MLAGRALAPAGQIVGLLMQYQGARTAMTSLEQIMAKPVERPAGETFIHRPQLRGEIEFRGERCRERITLTPEQRVEFVRLDGSAAPVESTAMTVTLGDRPAVQVVLILFAAWLAMRIVRRLTLRLAQAYALPLEQVREVMAVPVEITALPKTDAVMVGVAANFLEDFAELVVRPAVVGVVDADGEPAAVFELLGRLLNQLADEFAFTAV